MADAHEEQLLSELLDEIKTADSRLDASDLESRVMSAWHAETVRIRLGEGRRPRPAYYKIAAAAVVAVALSLFWYRRADQLPAVAAPMPRLAAINAPIDVPNNLPISLSPIAQSPIAQSPIAQSPIPQSPMEFVPLMPMTEHELAGSFQIVRVQMPRVSLGALTPPNAYPHEFVEADVLLGEDGMARAIRVSTGNSTLPWRSQ